MTNQQTLMRHGEIQSWVSRRMGTPAIARIRDNFGEVKARLALKFNGSQRPVSAPSVDDGLSPVSWSAWLAELDRQNLALKVSGSEQPDFEFVARRGESLMTGH